MYSEEMELERRDPEQDYKQYKQTCESLASLMGEIQELKAAGAKEGVRETLKQTHPICIYIEGASELGFLFTCCPSGVNK